MAPRKRPLELTMPVDQPPLTSHEFDAWHDGIDLFDRGEYWLAHERWEEVWRGMGDGVEHDAEIVIRGFIQLAAALHLVGIARLDGARSNFAKAAAKLALAPTSFLGVDVVRVRESIPLSVAALPDLAPIRIRTEGEPGRSGLHSKPRRSTN